MPSREIDGVINGRLVIARPRRTEIEVDVYEGTEKGPDHLVAELGMPKQLGIPLAMRQAEIETIRRIPRATAEACVEKIRDMYPGFSNEEVFDRPLLLWDRDGDRKWTIHWEHGPYEFATVVPQGRPPGVPAAVDWPVEVAVSPVNGQVLRLYTEART